MRRAPEPLSSRTRLLQDVSTLAILGLILVPFYLLLNEYWKSLALLTAGYGILAYAFLRLGRYMRHAMRRAPADILPWQRGVTHATAWSQSDIQFSAAEAVQYVAKDPHYLEEVLKPRLRQIVAYRLSGNPALSLEALDMSEGHQVEPAVMVFLQEHGATDLWTKYRYRHQRVQHVLAVLRQIEAL